MTTESQACEQLQRPDSSAVRTGEPWSIVRAARRLALPLLVFCWPALYLFRHIVAVDGSILYIGNDFFSLYYKYKVYLLDCLANFHFPLWSPSEAAGFPFYTNPFAQALYPGNVPLVLWYGAVGHYSIIDHQLFTVLGISIFALGLFVWLRRINEDTKAVLFAVLVMSVSFKVTEIIRFPNAVHAAAWYPWILHAITRILFSGSTREAARWAGLLALFAVCLCTAGYPYYAFYAIFLVVPYLLAIVIAPLRKRLFGDRPISPRRGFAAIAVAGLVTALLCGPYLVGFVRLMSQTVDRGGKSFEYSTEIQFDIEDTLGSLVYPPASSTEGWYFFSITALLVVMVYLLCRQNVAADKEAPGGLSSGSAWVKLFFVAWIGTISWISYGKSSYLFIVLWNYMPGFSSLRAWGRLNIILVPILAWLVSIAYAHFARMLKRAGGPGVRGVALELSVMSAVYAAVLGVQQFLHLRGVRDVLWSCCFRDLFGNEKWFIVLGAVAWGVLVVTSIVASNVRLDHGRMAAVTAVLIAVATTEMWHTGSRQWSNPEKAIQARFKIDIAKADVLSFKHVRTDQYDTIMLGPIFNVGVVDNWYLGRYVGFLARTGDERRERFLLLGILNGQKIFFSESIEHTKIATFLADTLRYSRTGRLVSYNGDELVWQTDAPRDGYLSFIDNWDPSWKAWVDGEPVAIERLFGTFKSVRLRPGAHTVRFCYQPGLLPAI